MVGCRLYSRAVKGPTGACSVGAPFGPPRYRRRLPCLWPDTGAAHIAGLRKCRMHTDGATRPLASNESVSALGGTSRTVDFSIRQQFKVS